VDGLYFYLNEGNNILKLISFENQPKDALWGERFFHIRDPDGYQQLSFAKPVRETYSVKLLSPFKSCQDYVGLLEDIR
jgi:hypothetical protein